MNLTTRTPYDAAHVAIVDTGRAVWALYIPDAEQAKDPRAVLDNLTAPEYADVEVVATATRHYRSEGAPVSGWFIASGPDSGSEGYANKQAMRDALRITIGGYFARSAAPQPADSPQEAPSAPVAAQEQQGAPQDADSVEARRDVLRAAALPRPTHYTISVSDGRTLPDLPWGIAMAQAQSSIRRGATITVQGGGVFTLAAPDGSRTAVFAPAV